ncbi:hypothetical protein NL54_11060 [Pantoea stewartii]|uniref:MBL fold metallo-hydrolase n=1 Tax=Pantoea stewartii TaxID=66269 RepID=UPI00054370F8|nr:MBL fold metallo-hydrolase [Pantoea stewartii]KHE01361.1 hypothetical protein NL54_11060 [Pantoea stewartii]KHN61261.1 hypothetical protein OI73_17790 [Pantoea stewartii]
MASLTVVSGVGGKLPAAFLLEIQGYRLLWDLGAGPEPGVRPDLAAIGQVDAICLTHSHRDHTGALDSWQQLGSPPVYATDITWQQLGDGPVPARCRHALPLQGQCAVGPLNLFTGRSGHSPGSVWLHLPVAGGITYMGDWSRESLLLPFDRPPRARWLITDASYGDRHQRLHQQVDALVQAARHGAVVTAPLHGRGPEMALRLRSQGLPVRLCPQVREEVSQLLAQKTLPAATALALLPLLGEPTPARWQPDSVIVAADAVADSGLAATLSHCPEFTLIFSSHVARGTRAFEMLQNGLAQWLPWNVHPPLDDQLALIKHCGAEQVIPAFVAPEQCQQLMARAGSTLCWQRHFTLSSRWESFV